MSLSNLKPEKDDLPSLGKLWFSLLIAVIVVVVLSVVVVLPAERGVDITGLGERLQLTRIGLLKTAMQKPDAPMHGRPSQQDELSITLKAGSGREIKMDMQKGFTAHYSWVASGGPVEHDTHGDIYDNEEVYISYSLADAVESDSGTITAPFGGNHGWFWLNRNDNDVVITLKTRGEYVAISAK